MEQKRIVHNVIPQKSSVQNGISTEYLGMEIPFKTGHSTA